MLAAPQINKYFALKIPWKHGFKLITEKVFKVVFIYLKPFLYKLFFTNHLMTKIAKTRWESDSDGISGLTIS